MTSVLEVESRLTDRYQTTVPAAVRKALSLEKRDKLCFVVQSDGQVVLTRANDGGSDDPVLGQFLDFLASDMANNPERLQTLDAGLAERMNELVGELDIDLATELPDDDE